MDNAGVKGVDRCTVENPQITSNCPQTQSSLGICGRLVPGPLAETSLCGRPRPLYKNTMAENRVHSWPLHTQTPNHRAKTTGVY